MAPELHPNLEALAPLLGAWAGQGAGKYPTIEPFEYLEEVVFSHVGKPFLAYAQKTRAVSDGKPLHAETGICECRNRVMLSWFSLTPAASLKSRWAAIR